MVSVSKTDESGLAVRIRLSGLTSDVSSSSLLCTAGEFTALLRAMLPLAQTVGGHCAPYVSILTEKEFPDDKYHQFYWIFDIEEHCCIGERVIKEELRKVFAGDEQERFTLERPLVPELIVGPLNMAYRRGNPFANLVLADVRYFFWRLRREISALDVDEVDYWKNINGEGRWGMVDAARALPGWSQLDDRPGCFNSELFDYVEEKLPLVECRYCTCPTREDKAHRYQRGFVGECCWDERLHSS